MGNANTKSNGCRIREYPIELAKIMRSMDKEVQSYREDIKRMMRDHEEILQSLNMLQKQVNKYSGRR
jgi:hypothetical protein